MIRITLPYVWGLSESLEQIAHLDHTKEWDRFDLVVELIGADTALENLLVNSVFSATLRSSRPLAERLLVLIREQTRGNEPMEKPVPRYVISNIQQAYGQFKTAFLAELGTFPAYFVSQKGSHDTLTLLDQPALMFPPDLKDKVPEAMFDVAEAGKALCYETATACGFHVFRATEAVLRRYYSHVTNGKAHPKVRNIMVYVTAMRQAKCGDEKVLSVIEQLAKLHRNPIAHPEAVLTVEEAISMLGVARSAVAFMLAALPVPPPTTTTSAAPSLPAAAPAP